MAERKIYAGHAVRRMRRASGLTQTALADMLEISPSYLNLIEKNQRPLSAMLMVRLADEIGERQGHRPLVVVDNTFLGPFAQRPIEIGVDLNMTSLTKYCAGHSDLLAGGVSGKAEGVAIVHLQRTPQKKSG